MAEKKQTDKTEPTVEEESGPNPVKEVAHKALLLGLGAASLAKDGVEIAAGKMIERGEIAEEKARKAAGEAQEKAKKAAEDAKEKRKEQTKKVEAEVDKQVEAVVTKLNVPTRADLDALNEKIAELNAKLDALNAQTPVAKK